MPKSNIPNIFIHVICDDKEYEQSMFSFDNGNIIVKPLSTTEDYDNSNQDQDKGSKEICVTTLTSSNIKLLGDYGNRHNAFDSTDPLVLSSRDWKAFVSKNYDPLSHQIYTMMVSQNVTNSITPDILSLITNENISSTFLHLKSSKMPSYRTQAILKFLESYKIEVHNVEYNANINLQLLLTTVANILSSMQNNSKSLLVPWNRKHQQGWKPNQLQQFNENANIDQFLFPKSTSTGSTSLSLYSASRMFQENCKFMNHFDSELSKQDITTEFTKIKLNYIQASNYDTNVVKYLIGNNNDVSFWYWQNNRKITTPLREMDPLWQKAKHMIRRVFPGDNDAQPINDTMTHKGTKLIIIAYYPSSETLKSIGCVVFKTLLEPPFGLFVSYVSVNNDMKGAELDQQFALSGDRKCQLHFRGIGRKLLNLAQYMSWTQSRNIDLHLCATKDSKQFYEYLNFDRYDSDMMNLPPLIKQHLDDETIEQVVIDANELFPMYLKDTLLASVPLPVSRTLKSYYQILLANKTTGV